MHTVLFLAVALIMAIPAQGKTSIELGVLGGINVSQFHDHATEGALEFDSFNGFHVGAVLNLNFHPSINLSLRPRWIERGTQETRPGNLRQDIITEYLSIPILAQFTLGSGRVIPYLIGGMDLAFLISAQEEAGGNPMDIKDDFEPMALGLTMGAGLQKQFGRRTLFAQGMYGYGLTNLSAGAAGSLAMDPERDLVFRGFEFSLGLTFRLGESR